ncbi:TIGR03086 family metal-binding protein [Pedococcus sp. NPDC057267]|uniref:TIGR03086 family metal-binding protein n=1 Tax=Pedococcus sp. NPDC057267 TaxID=3346077 RepID=UPI0036318181
MTTATGVGRPPGAVELLERAVAYTGASLRLVTEADLRNATPCAEWDLLTLLLHMEDSLDAMAEAARAPRLELVPRAPGEGGRALLDRICARARALVGCWYPARDGEVRLGDLGLPRDLLGAVGALEITVHGWDVAQAIGQPRPIPPGLAMDLWPVARDAITDADRPLRFGPALDVPDWAAPQHRLLAHAGRC